MNRPRRLATLVTVLAFTVAACVPVSVPGLRHIDGQTWNSRFDVQVQVGPSVVNLPVDLAITFRQQLQSITADATLQYDAGIFRLQTGRLVEMHGHLGFDDSLTLDSSAGTLSFTGQFVGDRLVGTVAIAGVVPVADVVFARAR